MQPFQQPLGKREFVQLICDRHNDALILYAVGQCKGFHKDHSFAYDLVQDVYLKALTHFEVVYTGYQKSGVKYLCGMIKYRIRDDKRKITSISRVEETFNYGMPKISTIDSLCYNIEHERFFKFLEKHLKERDAEIMILYIKGYKHKEIAALFDIKLNTISTKISRAKKVLAKYFD
jgi:RNA polymerase sigma-70 factor (ECF subfamily)